MNRISLLERTRNSPNTRLFIGLSIFVIALITLAIVAVVAVRATSEDENEIAETFRLRERNRVRDETDLTTTTISTTMTTTKTTNLESMKKYGDGVIHRGIFLHLLETVRAVQDDRRHDYRKVTRLPLSSTSVISYASSSSPPCTSPVPLPHPVTDNIETVPRNSSSTIIGESDIEENDMKKEKMDNQTTSTTPTLLSRRTRSSQSEIADGLFAVLLSTREIDILSKVNTTLARRNIHLTGREEIYKVSKDCKNKHLYLLDGKSSTVYSFRADEPYYLPIVIPRPNKSTRIVDLVYAWHENLICWIERDHYKVAPELYCASITTSSDRIHETKKLIYILPWHVTERTVIKYLEDSRSFLLGMNFANTFVLLQISIPSDADTIFNDDIQHATDADTEKNRGDEFHNSDGSLIAFGKDMVYVRPFPTNSSSSISSHHQHRQTELPNLKNLRVHDIIVLRDSYVIVEFKETRRYHALYLLDMKPSETSDVDYFDDTTIGNAHFLHRLDRRRNSFQLSLAGLEQVRPSLKTLYLVYFRRSVFPALEEDANFVSQLLDTNKTNHHPLRSVEGFANCALDTKQNGEKSSYE